MIKNYKQFNESLRDLMVGPTEEEFLHSMKDKSMSQKLDIFIKNNYIKGVEDLLLKNVDLKENYNIVAKAISYDCDDELIYLLINNGASLIAYDYDCLFASIRKHRNNIFKYIFDKLNFGKEEVLNIKHIIFISGENREEEYNMIEWCKSMNNNELLEYLKKLIKL